MSDEEKVKEIVAKLIDKIMDEYSIDIWELEHFSQHECERCDH